MRDARNDPPPQKGDAGENVRQMEWPGSAFHGSVSTKREFAGRSPKPISGLISVDGCNGETIRPDWRASEQYAILEAADRSAFAWEWLRRTWAYQAAWQRRGDDAIDPRQFGLERLENPSHPIPEARPVWSSRIDPSVVVAAVDDLDAGEKDRIDLLRLSRFVSVTIDDEHIEHLLLSDGKKALRIDIVEGSLIGCPASLRYRLSGVDCLQAPMNSLTRLLQLVRYGTVIEPKRLHLRRRNRWILELRIADAIHAGADHQEIARVLFGAMISDRRWRRESSAYRQRVQRLARNARTRLSSPLDERWFAVT